ncbi:MAG: AMP-binding protein [Rhodospirillales bacterium]|nr:AMP-binding protein [Alphaproteobacteria bacterium]MCB9986379.1 AMP-binding protein [Rhodospirillales bacterium]USO07072.1 MAG: AMP-binding protein [Rhodospirillales bacterium]
MSLIVSALKQQANALALAGAGCAYTSRALVSEVMARVAHLAASRVRVLGLYLGNGVEWVLWDLAALEAGIVCVPLPPFFTKDQVDYVIAAAGIDHVLDAQGLKPTGKHAVPLPEGTAKITFTSGTTGMPKGVCLSEKGMEQVARSIMQMVGPIGVGNHLCVMPLSILLENVAGVYAGILAGAALYVEAPETVGMSNPFRPDFSRLLDVLAERDIATMILVPELLRGIVATLRAAPRSLPFLRFVAVGGSKIAQDLIVAARAAGLPAYEGYGLSECASVVSLNTPGNDRAGSVGTLLPHVTAIIEGGEIVIRDPAFLGYLGDADAPQKNFATGDLGRFGEGGTLYIDGRKKNVLITSHGRNVAPEWSESELLAQPEIAQAIVYGDGLPALYALIVSARPDADVPAAVARANARLPAYARIDGFTAVPPFTVADGTLTGTGRPRRTNILSRYQSIIVKESENEFLSKTG